MHLVGSFLAALFSNESLGGYSLRARRMSLSVTSVSSQSTHILHSCQGFSQAQLLRQIVSIYGGVPEAFEVFHCRPTTTKEELRLFLDPKRATKQPFQFLMLEVNRLPYQLQEVRVTGSRGGGGGGGALCVCVCVCARSYVHVYCMSLCV